MLTLGPMVRAAQSLLHPKPEVVQAANPAGYGALQVRHEPDATPGQWWGRAPGLAADESLMPAIRLDAKPTRRQKGHLSLGSPHVTTSPTIRWLPQV